MTSGSDKYSSSNSNGVSSPSSMLIMGSTISEIRNYKIYINHWCNLYTFYSPRFGPSIHALWQPSIFNSCNANNVDDTSIMVGQFLHFSFKTSWPFTASNKIWRMILHKRHQLILLAEWNGTSSLKCFCNWCWHVVWKENKYYKNKIKLIYYSSYLHLLCGWK